MEQFNSYNKLNKAVEIIDLLIYVGNKIKYFKQFLVIGGKISMQIAKDCIPSENIVNFSYDIFSEMPDIVISQIISPRIRNEIYE